MPEYVDTGNIVKVTVEFQKATFVCEGNDALAWLIRDTRMEKLFQDSGEVPFDQYTRIERHP